MHLVCGQDDIEIAREPLYAMGGRRRAAFTGEPREFLEGEKSLLEKSRERA